MNSVSVSQSPAPMTVGEMYAKFGPSIYSRCRRLLKDPIAAQDATQDIFLKVMRYIDRAPDEHATLSWIYRISTNHCLNLIRDVRRRPEPMDLVPEQTEPSFEKGVVDRNFTNRLMGDAPEELRAPVILFHVKGMEQARIAEVLGISRRTVLNRLSAFTARARALSRKAESDAVS